MEVCESRSGAGTLERVWMFPEVDGSHRGQDRLAWAASCSTMQNINRRSFGMTRTRAVDQNRKVGYNGRGPVMSAMAALEMQE